MCLHVVLAVVVLPLVHCRLTTGRQRHGTAFVQVRLNGVSCYAEQAEAAVQGSTAKVTDVNPCRTDQLRSDALPEWLQPADRQYNDGALLLMARWVPKTACWVASRLQAQVRGFLAQGCKDAVPVHQARLVKGSTAATNDCHVLQYVSSTLSSQ